MKIEIIDDAQAEPEQVWAQQRNPGLIARAAFTIALAAFLVVALRWALIATTANARQVSTSLAQLQDGFEKPTRRAASPLRTSLADRTNRDGGANDGPILEPADKQ